MATAKQIVLAKFPAAKCTMKWGVGYRVTLGATTQDYNGHPISEVQTRTQNPQEAWELVAHELKLI